MKEKRTIQFAFFNARALSALSVCAAAACSVVSGTLLAFFRPEAQPKISIPVAAGLTFAQRVAYQRAIEEVYWRHRIWPRNGGERSDAKPSLDAVISHAQLEKKSQTTRTNLKRMKIGSRRLLLSSYRLK